MANEINGNAGDDTMYGGSGNDIFDWNEYYRDGTDTMYGGTGDTYVLDDSASDTIIEYVNEGTDTIWAPTDYTLPYNVEILLGFGSLGNLNLQGNRLDNVISGSSLNDTLTGHGGADDFLLYLGMVMIW